MTDIVLFIPALSGVEKQEQRQATHSTRPKTKTESVWYHEGPPELLAARYAIADYSITRYIWAVQCGCGQSNTRLIVLQG